MCCWASWERDTGRLETSYSLECLTDTTNFDLSEKRQMEGWGWVSSDSDIGVGWLGHEKQTIASARWTFTTAAEGVYCSPCPHFLTELQVSCPLPHTTLFIHARVVLTVLLYTWTFTQSRVFSRLLSCLAELHSVSRSSVFAPSSPWDSQGSRSDHKFY